LTWPSFGPPSHSFGEAGFDGRVLCGNFVRRVVRVFIALVGLAGPLLKRQ
jgi:hypothetical protein